MRLTRSQSIDNQTKNDTRQTRDTRVEHVCHAALAHGAQHGRRRARLQAVAASHRRRLSLIGAATLVSVRPLRAMLFCFSSAL